MAGNVCIVTGATSGLGLATARELVRRGHTVVIVGRNAAKCAGVAGPLALDARPGCVAGARRRHDRLPADCNTVDGVTGRYFVNREPVASSPASRDATAAEHLWTVSETLVASSARKAS